VACETIRRPTFLNVFYIFFPKSKKHDFYVVRFAAHVFSNSEFITTAEFVSVTVCEQHF